MTFRNLALFLLAFTIPAAQAAQNLELISFSQTAQQAIARLSDNDGNVVFGLCMLPANGQNLTIGEANKFLAANRDRACFRRTSEVKISNDQDASRFAELLKDNFAQTVSTSLKIDYKEGIRSTEMLLPLTLMPLVGPVFFAPIASRAFDPPGVPKKPWNPRFKKFFFAASAVTAAVVGGVAVGEYYIYRSQKLNEASAEAVASQARAAGIEDVQLQLLDKDAGYVQNLLFRAFEKAARDFNQSGAK